MTRTIISIISIIVFTTTNLFAQTVSLPGFSGSRGGSEYWVGREQGKPLIVVNLVNGVSNPGIYHIPIDTDIAQLIAYAGGSEKNSQLDKIQIRRQKTKDQIEYIQYDFEKITKANSPMPILADKDVVNIPVSWNVERTAQYVGILAGITAILLSINTLEKSNR